ncbi:hypothetical protein [Morganella morganii]|uniref:hypothetical protein n=1 Tax=Morganella morganii TaxID=582 RepID=UPI000BBCFC71|nr:hypothetical protein [Morganella morganii]ATF52950.1 hypothetical protein CO693_04125 [Morganella morganii]ELJ5776854.1 hypothetical protein [Morganella morganii]
MSENKINFKDNINCVNEYADHFGYSSYGNGDNRVGSIAFFKHATEWVNNTETELNRYPIANIRMSEKALLELAQFIIEQHEASLGDESDKSGD